MKTSVDTEHLRAGAATGPAPWVRRQLQKTCNEVDRLRAENARLREALQGIATSRHCETEGCNEAYPMCEVMEARAALTETEAT